MEYSSARSKADATARMYVLAGLPPEPLGPGSKERRSALEALARFLGIEEDLPSRKPAAGKVLAARLGVDWDETCYSRGATITTVGINRLVDAAVEAHLAVAGDVDTDDFIANVMNATTPDRREPDNNAADQQEPTVSDDLTVIEASIAQSIAQLAATGQTPEGIKAAPTQIDTGAVRLDDGSWRERLSDVEGWLHLPRDLDKLAGPDGFDASLVEALGLESDSDTANDLLFTGLAERLDRATALRDEFVARMEDAAEGAETLTTASQAWVKGWEETEEDEEEEAEAEGAPINAAADTWPITDFVQHAKDNELNLSPSYQRADVWPTGDAQLLIESILRGIPLPSVIILETDGDVTTNYEVVDGKQRLTSILRFIGKHPRATELVAAKATEWGAPEAETLFQDDYPEFKRLWNKKEGEKLTSQVERRLYFPFALRRPSRGPLGPSGSLTNLRGKYYSEIREETIQVQAQPKKVKSVFEQTSAYKIPVITYTKVTPAQVHEVFSLYNKQGKHLNAEEIRNALYHELYLMKALLVTAGDSEDVATVAPFLVDVWDDLSSTPKALDEWYGFGRVGYKRTKILSWTAASLFLDDDVLGRSTTSHINALLKSVQDNKTDRLRNADVVKAAMVMLDHGVDAHANLDANEGWAPAFKNAQGGGKWQELQLVASLIGLSIGALVHGEEIFDIVEEVAPAIGDASRGWMRPGSAQSKDQWEFLAKVVRELLEVLEIDPAAAHKSIEKQFGRSGLLSLLSV